jgi:hypothetical protein
MVVYTKHLKACQAKEVEVEDDQVTHTTEQQSMPTGVEVAEGVVAVTQQPSQQGVMVVRGEDQVLQLAATAQMEPQLSLVQEGQPLVVLATQAPEGLLLTLR